MKSDVTAGARIFNRSSYVGIERRLTWTAYSLGKYGTGFMESRGVITGTVRFNYQEY